MGSRRSKRSGIHLRPARRFCQRCALPQSRLTERPCSTVRHEQHEAHHNVCCVFIDFRVVHHADLASDLASATPAMVRSSRQQFTSCVVWSARAEWHKNQCDSCVLRNTVVKSTQLIMIVGGVYLHRKKTRMIHVFAKQTRMIHAYSGARLHKLWMLVFRAAPAWLEMILQTLPFVSRGAWVLLNVGSSGNLCLSCLRNRPREQDKCHSCPVPVSPQLRQFDVSCACCTFRRRSSICSSAKERDAWMRLSTGTPMSLAC